jgi:hypothetical protein
MFLDFFNCFLKALAKKLQKKSFNFSIARANLIQNVNDSGNKFISFKNRAIGVSLVIVDVMFATLFLIFRLRSDEWTKIAVEDRNEG